MRSLWLSLAALLWATSAWAAAPTFDAASGSCTVSGGVISWSHTFGASADGAIIGTGQSQGATISSITVGGSSTGVAKIDSLDDADSNSFELWRVIAPGTGTKTITVTSTNSGSSRGCAGIISLIGTHQTTPDTAHAHANNTTGSSSALTVNVTSNTGELVVGVGVQNTGNTFTSTGTGQTEQLDVRDVSNNYCLTMATQTGASTTTHSYTASGNKEWGIIAASIQPAAGGGGSTTHNLMLMGVGK